VRPFVAVGLLGSLTTFSTWMVEFDQMLVDGATLLAVSYLAASIVVGVAATALGLVLGRWLAARRYPPPMRGRR
jgi:fluoride exporter